MTTLDILKGARAWLADRRNWIKGSYATSRSGKSTFNAIDLARRPAVGSCTCMLGALIKVSGDDDLLTPQSPLGKALSHAFQVEDVYSFAKWNDAPERTHAEVIARFDAAIARLEDGQ